MGILEKLNKIMYKSYVLYIPRQGGRKPVKKVLARSMSDLRETVESYLSENQDDLDVQSCKYVICVSENGEEVKIKNPYYIPPKKEKYDSVDDVMSDVWKTMYQGLLSSIITQLPEMISGLFSMNIDLFRSMLQKMGETFFIRNERSEIGEVVELIKGLVSLAKHRNEVLSLSREIGKFLMSEGEGEGEGEGGLKTEGGDVGDK